MGRGHPCTRTTQAGGKQQAAAAVDPGREFGLLCQTRAVAGIDGGSCVGVLTCYAARVPPRTRGRTRFGSQPLARLLALWLVLIALASPRPVIAAPPPGSDPDMRPVIVSGREDEILELFAPYALGDEVAPEQAPGWTLHSFDIEVGTIVVWLASSSESYAQLRFDHPDYGPPGAKQLSGFAVHVVEQPPGSEPAVAQIIAQVDQNDGGSFWRTDVVYGGEPREHPYDIALLQSRFADQFELWFRDGLVFLAFVTLTVLGLVAYVLRECPTWIRVALLVVALLGALLRVLISPEVGLDPWSYSRLIIPAGRIYHGPGLAVLHPEPAWLTETITTSTLAYAVLTPLAVFVHARYLLDDARAGLFVAVLVAVMPLHLRFSHSDTAFISSITVSSMVFGLLYVVTRTPSRFGGLIAMLLLALPILQLYQLRPLNILYFPMLVATPFLPQALYGDNKLQHRPRVIATLVLLSVLTFGWGVPTLLENFGPQVSEGLSIQTLISAATVVFSPRFNVLLNPVFTPPGLTLLAVFGGIDLWRRNRRWLLGFLVMWLLGVLAAHAYVVPGTPYMQARYHLQLLLPFMLLCACGAEAGIRWLLDNRERKTWLAGRRYDAVRVGVVAYVLASPLIHLYGIRNVAFNDMLEWKFVHGLREQVPAECTILEYTGERAGMRFGRVGAAIERGVERPRWKVIEILESREGEPEIPDDVRALLEDPPECLYWYEGLPCFAYKSPQERKAPACHAIEGFVSLEEVASTSFESEPYDENLSRGLGDMSTIELRLFRATPKPRSQ